LTPYCSPSTRPQFHPIAYSFSVSQQQYADDTQLFLALSQPNYTSDLTNLEKCLAYLNNWFCLNSLALNPDKSDNILLGTRQRAHSYSKLISVNVAGSVVALANHIKILGVTLDSQLIMDRHVNDVCRSAFFHVPALRHIRSAITDEVAKAVACAFVGARLDYANSVLYGVSSKNIAHLQRMHNALARVAVGQSASHFISTCSTLRDLHWLPLEYRIKLKIAKLAYNARVSFATVYLSSLVSDHTSERNLRATGSNLLHVPSHRLKMGFRAFRVAAPHIFNSLPAENRACTSTDSFCRQLKTFYFKSAFVEA
jgi:hypothetical protein